MLNYYIISSLFISNQTIIRETKMAQYGSIENEMSKIEADENLPVPTISDYEKNPHSIRYGRIIVIGTILIGALLLVSRSTQNGAQFFKGG